MIIFLCSPYPNLEGMKTCRVTHIIDRNIMDTLRVLDTSSCYKRAAMSCGWRESPHNFASTMLRIGQKWSPAIDTKRMARSATHFEEPQAVQST